MNFPDVLRMLRRQFVLIIAATLIGLSAGAITAMLTPARYQASTDVFLSVEVSPDATPGERLAAAGYITQVIDSYRAVINTSLVLQPVVDALGLEVSAQQLSGSVQTTATLRSAVITITASSPNAGQAARIANAVADSFADAVPNTLEKRGENAPYGVRVVQVQSAQVPTAPVAPNLRLSLVLGGLAGLAVGIGVALLRATLDTRIRTAEELEHAVDKPVLGRFALSSDAAGQAADRRHEPRGSARRVVPHPAHQHAVPAPRRHDRRLRRHQCRAR
ncbi:Wzz/FepE/Etk N-terminal domain-containing protein [Microbacterium sp. KUDC0406]|uniref:YveK family protein n=1 Tax=Microbacterium sp. KUDC0406 TaxID=2909588 RepID=UPI001F30F4DC|nr:Wzz/FepE/Etk N-terminal domain-containing protein [Microbacterium sp. KUDC0406]UJP08923.1 Wzz/FepE/Etk N-terminal domain-containing protein [Microbacterium sp. KUDC0406]